MNNDQKKVESSSKFLSLVLRHKPEQIGITLDAEGWTSVDELIKLANAAGQSLDRQTIIAVVAGSDKQRFALSDDDQRIRANQGHSVHISLGLEHVVPPDALYHGTASRFLDSIRVSGLHSAERQHVHLSTSFSAAAEIGARHGKPVVLAIDSKAMAAEGYLFYLSKNYIWLTEKVPPKYISETSK